MKLFSIIVIVLALALPGQSQTRTVREATAAEVTAGTVGLPAVVTPRRLVGGGGGISSNTVYQMILAYGGGGTNGGGVVSNGTATLVIDTWYTNTTANSLWVIANPQLQGAASANTQCRMDVDFSPPDGIADWWRRVVRSSGVDGVGFVDVVELSGLVPPGAAFRYLDDSISGTATLDNVSQLVYLGGTNSGGSGTPFDHQLTNATVRGNLSWVSGMILAVRISPTNAVFDTGVPVSIGTNNASGADLSVQGSTRLSGSIDVKNASQETTTKWGTNHVEMGSGTRSNGLIFVKDGAVWMPSAAWGAGTEYQGNRHAGALKWHGNVGVSNNFPIADNGAGTEFAKIQGFYNWGSTPANPWIMMTAANVRLEEGSAKPGNPWGGEVELGNEDHFGEIGINFVPIINAAGTQYNTDGYSHPLMFNAVYTIGAGGGLFSRPGIRGRPTRLGGTYGPGGNQVSYGELEFFTLPPVANGQYITNAYTDYPGEVVMVMRTNALEVRGSGGFIGSGRSLTNFQHAVYHRALASGAVPDKFASGSFTNVILTTNGAFSFNSDPTSAFTQSNSFLIVNAAGAGKWRIKSRVVIHNNTDNTGEFMTRIYRWNNSPTGLLHGSGGYQYYYNMATSEVCGVTTLTAGDVIALQVFANATANTTVGRSVSSGDPFSCAFIEFERF